MRSRGRGPVPYVHRHFARRNASVVRKHLAESDLKLELRTASTQIVPADAAMPQPSDPLKQATPADFATRWPDLPDSQDPPTGQVANHPTNDADQPMRLTVPVVDAKRAGQQQASAGNSALGPVFLNGVLALLLAGGVFVVNWSRRTDFRDHWRTAAARASQSRHGTALVTRLGTGWRERGNRPLLPGCRLQPICLTNSRRTSGNSHGPYGGPGWLA